MQKYNLKPTKAIPKQEKPQNQTLYNKYNEKLSTLPSKNCKSNKLRFKY